MGCSQTAGVSKELAVNYHNYLTSLGCTSSLVFLQAVREKRETCESIAKTLLTALHHHTLQILFQLYM